MRRPIALLVLLVALLATGSTTASAATKLDPVVADCNKHSSLTAHYTIAQLRTALSTMPADVKEYTNCYDLIERQLISQLGGSSGSGSSSSDSSGGSFLPTPVIVVLVLLVLGAVTLGAVALRRRGRPPVE